MFNLGRAQTIALSIALFIGGIMLALIINGYVDSELVSVAFYPLIVFLLLNQAFGVLRRFAVMQDPTLVRVRDVSAAHRRPADMLTGTLRELERIGFWRMGEVEVASPVEGATTRWLLFHQERAIMAEVRPSELSPIITYTTVFDDRSVVETVCPFGLSIHQPDFWRQLYRDEPVVTYNLHWNNVIKFRSKRGAMPVTLRSMNSWLRWRQVYHEAYYSRRLVYGLGLGAAMLICLLIVLVIFSINIYADLEDLTLTLTVRIAIDVLLLGGVVMYLLINWFGGQRDEVA